MTEFTEAELQRDKPGMLWGPAKRGRWAEAKERRSRTQAAERQARRQPLASARRRGDDMATPSDPYPAPFSALYDHGTSPAASSPRSGSDGYGHESAHSSSSYSSDSSSSSGSSDGGSSGGGGGE